jgi:hypothetical protein
MDRSRGVEVSTITVGYNHRAWATFTVKGATAEEIEALREDGEQLITTLQEWDAAGRLEHEGTQFDDNPEFFVDYVETALVGSDITPTWYRPPHPLGKWHLIKSITQGSVITLYTAACGGGIGDHDGSVQTSVGIPTDPICKKCKTINERSTP